MTMIIQIAFGVLGGYWLIRLVESWPGTQRVIKRRTQRVIKPGAGLCTPVINSPLAPWMALLVFGIFGIYAVFVVVLTHR